MATGIVDDLSTTGWIFQGELQEPGYGYIVRELMHDMHPFAKEIRVEQVQIAGNFQPLSSKSKSWQDGNFLQRESFKLGPPVMARTGGPELIRPSAGKSFSDPRGFYNPLLSTLTVYEMNNIFGEPNQSMGIGFGFMFTTYSKNTLHEPSGILKAARVYPVVNFISPAPTSPLTDPKNRISAIRVIFRVELAVSGLDFVETVKSIRQKQPKLSNDEVNALALAMLTRAAGRNQAGFWTDHDDPSDLQALSIRTSLSGKWPGYQAFARAEKPLLWEATGSGLLEGHYRTTQKGTLWDNFHQWQGSFNSRQELLDAYKNGGQMPPSPGMPYAAHLHWRWSADAYKGSKLLGPGGKQFGGVGGAGGPMIDPRLPDQDLHFAITQRNNFEPTLDIMDEYYKNNKHVFGIQDTIEDLFSQISGKRKNPREIWHGDNLVLWLDFMARSNHLGDIKQANANIFEGAFFVNGIFFAHEPISVMPFLTVLGAYKPQFITSTPKHKWERL
jgi:hypothetical protein